MSPRYRNLLVLLLAFASPLHAEDECGGYAEHGDPLFGAIGPGIGGMATVLHAANDARACIESAACVEQVFPMYTDNAIFHDGCPFGFGANADDAKRLDDFGARAATLDGSCFLRFALTAASQHRREFTPMLTARLRDDDARAAVAAALALRDLGEADAGVWQIAAQHWYPGLRELACAAATGTDTELLDAPQRSFWTRVEEIDGAFAQRWCAAQATPWRGKRVPDDDSHDDDTDTVPLAAMGLRHEQGWPVCGFETGRVPFAGGMLVGTNMGEWGGDAYFLRAPELPRPLLSDNVQGVRVSGDRAQIFAGINHMSLNESRVYRIAPDAQGVPRILATIEFPEARWRAQWHGDAITVVGQSGIVYELGPDDAHPHVLGCAPHSRRFYPKAPEAWSTEPFVD